MSRETTVRTPPPIRPDACSKIFIVFWCPPMICSPLLAKKYFPTPMATGVRRQSSLNQDPPIKNSWIRPWTSSL